MSAGKDSPAAGGRDETIWQESIAAVARGDQAALSRLYDDTSGLVYGLVLRILRDDGAAEEVTLDVYQQVWRRAATYDAERGRPSTWLLTIARSRAIDRLRATARERGRETLEVHPDLVDPAADPGAATEGEERRRQVLDALATLPPEQRQAIDLAFFSGLTHVEVAERLGEPLGTIKTRIRTGMIRLRDALRPLAEA